MRRKRTLILLTVLAALAALLSACGGGGSSSDSPQQVIENATFEGIESGTVDLKMNVKSTGEHGGDVKIALSGPFQSTGKKSLPEVALTLTAKGEADGEKVDFDGSLTALSDRAFVGLNGKQYEVEPTIFGFIKSRFEEAEQEGEDEGKGGEGTACQKAATSIKLEEFVDNLENEGGEEVEGVKTTKLSGDLEPKGAVDTVIKLAETPACASELERAGPFPLAELKRQEGMLTNAIKVAHVGIYVGESDHIVRKVDADLTVEPKGSGEQAEIEFDFTLGQVNEPQKITGPANAEPVTALLEELGIDPLELMGLGQGGGGEDFGGVIERITEAIADEGSASSGGGGSKNLTLGLPPSKAAREFNECLDEAGSAADLQKCATLME